MLAGWFVPDMGIFFASDNGNTREKPGSGLVSLGQHVVDDRHGRKKRGFYSHFAGIKQVRVGTVDMLRSHVVPSRICESKSVGEI